MYFKNSFKFINIKNNNQISKFFFFPVYNINKKIYSLFKFINRKFFFFFWKIEISCFFKSINAGLKFNPIISKIFNSYVINKNKKILEKSIFLELIINSKLGLNKQYISQLLRFLTFTISTRKKIFKYLFYFINKKLNIIFEETADELKFALNTKFIKLSLALNINIGRCWLVLKTSFFNTINFWKSYITSCYNSMTKYKKTFDFKQYKKDIIKNSVNTIYQTLDFNFFDLKQTIQSYFNKNKRNLVLNLEFERNFSSNSHDTIESFENFTHWKNRNKEKYMILKEKIYSSKINFRLPKFVILIK